MNTDRCYLLTILNGKDGEHGVLKVALKVPEEHAEEFFMEPDARGRLCALLPPHARGTIVDVEEIFEVYDDQA